MAIVYDQIKIEEFFNAISNMLYGKPYQDVVSEESELVRIIPPVQGTNVNNETEQVGDISTFQGGSVSGSTIEENDDSNLTQTISNTVQTIGRDVFNGCGTIIPYGYPIRTDNMRLNKIINELKRINADDYPNACGTLLRTLFELSAKVYLEKQDGQDHTETEFSPAIKQAANLLRQQRCIDDSQHSAICSDIDNLRKIFNGYMHNTESYPSSEALKNFFKCHRMFIQECLK